MITAREACDVPVIVGGSAGALLRRLRRLAIHDVGEPLDDSGIWRFGARHLRSLTQLTSIRVSNQGQWEAPWAPQRAEALLRLLADAPVWPPRSL